MKHESRELNDFWNINVQKLNEWMKNKNRKNPLRLMQTALTSLWCCAGWKFLSKFRIFSLPHHPPVGLHPSQVDKQNLFPAGIASYLCIHQVQSRSDWAAVMRSRWRIHRATIERFISVYIGGKDTTFRRSSCVLQFSFAGFLYWYTDS